MFVQIADAIADIPGQINAILASFAGDRILLMAAIMVLVVIVGTALDFIPTILILTPILMPIDPEVRGDVHGPTAASARNSSLARIVWRERRRKPFRLAGLTCLSRRAEAMGSPTWGEPGCPREMC
jgi:hypothetical protein